MTASIKVLLLAADPSSGGAGLRLDREVRTAVEAARMGRAGKPIEIVAEVVVRQADVVRALAQHDPHVVHFAGHGVQAGGVSGLQLDNGKVLHADQLAICLAPFPEVRMVVLNACGTLPVAQALHPGVDYAIAMERAIGDRAAVNFAGQLYAALSFGHSAARAFEMASADMRAAQGEQHAMPRLLVREGATEWPAPSAVDPSPSLLGQEHVIEETEIGGSVRQENASDNHAVPQVIRTTRSVIQGDYTGSNRMGGAPPVLPNLPR